MNCFCNVEGDDELPSLLCGSGIGFDDYEVKGMEMILLCIGFAIKVRSTE